MFLDGILMGLRCGEMYLGDGFGGCWFVGGMKLILFLGMLVDGR